jgi:hypothetical protein
MNDDDDDRNAYAPPASDSLPVDREVGPELALWADWEGRRLVYNIVLCVEVLLLFGIGGSLGWFFNPAFQKHLLFLALLANLCFCAGPVDEGYFRHFGVRGRAVGRVLFGLGLALAMLLTLWSTFPFALLREVP